MNAGITSAEIADYYNNQLEYMLSYCDGKNARLNEIKNSLGMFIKPGMSVLDIGCGIGITSKHMAELGAIVTAIDISPELIKRARVASAHDNITYIVADVDAMILDGSFDAIILADVFEHIRRDNVFRVINGLLKHYSGPHTRIYLNIPNYNFALFMAKNYPDKQQIVDEAWKIEDIVSLFASQNFVPIHMKIYGIDTFAQYNEYIFVNHDGLNGHYEKCLNRLYNKGENN